MKATLKGFYYHISRTSFQLVVASAHLNVKIKEKVESWGDRPAHFALLQIVSVIAITAHCVSGILCGLFLCV